MRNGEQNLRLTREIEANRAFLLTAYRQNPALLARAEPRIRELLRDVGASATTTREEGGDGTLHHLPR